MNKNRKSNDGICLLNDKYVLLKDVLPLPDDAKIELDLGCGKGDFSVAVASMHPERTIIAADVMLGRLRKVIAKARRNGINNLYFFRVEARHLLSIILPDKSVSRLHILCPDPWPKFRHRAHRLMSSDFSSQIARVLADDGVLHFATDDEEYLAFTRSNLASSGLFEETDTGCLADVADVKTEFECRWLAMGKTVTHTAWVKKLS